MIYQIDSASDLRLIPISDTAAYQGLGELIGGDMDIYNSLMMVSLAVKYGRNYQTSNATATCYTDNITFTIGVNTTMIAYVSSQ